MYNQEGHFSKDEISCDHCGESNMDERFLEWLAMLRIRCAFSFEVVSGYRCPEHPKEVEEPTSHQRGLAVDIKVSGKRAWILLREALDMRFIGVGVYQGKDQEGIIHLDMDAERGPPSVWSG